MSFSASYPFRRTRRLQYATFLLAVAILIAAFFLARKQETRKIVHDTTWLRKAQRQLAGSIENLEKQWRETIADVAKQEWVAARGDRGKAAANTFGIQQITFFENKVPEHIVLHHKQGSAPPPKPSLIENRGDFLITQEMVQSSVDGLWTSQPAGSDLYILSQGKARSIALLLHPEEAMSVIVQEIKKELPDAGYPEPFHGYFEISQGESSPIFQSGDQALKAYQPDEKIHHFSNLGEWTFRYWHSREVHVYYRMPILVIGSLLALVTLAVGWWLNREYQQMLKLAASRVSFVNAVSHELRTPLTNIILSADFIDESSETPKLKRCIHQIREESHRLARMVENVLNFSRFEGGKLTPDKRSGVHVHDLLENCLRQFRPSFQRKNITMVINAGELPPMHTDPDFLSQIILNLLSNIEKYAGRNSCAQLTAEATSTHLRVVVEDDGPGIPSEYEDKIFESFERVHEAVTTGVSGAGLGLAISRELAQQLGGSLTLLPSSQGATFQLLIPLT